MNKLKQESPVQWNFKSFTIQAGKAIKKDWACRVCGRSKKTETKGQEVFFSVPLTS